MPGMISIAERVAQLLADPTFEPELLAESQRSIELPWWFGQLRTDVAYARPQKMSVSAYRGFNPIGRNLQKPMPVRPREYRCAAYGSLVKHGQTGDGSYFKKPLNCGKCVRCLEWRVQLKMHQFALWAGRHTMVTASGFADPDDVRKWITGQGRAVGGQRVAMVRRNDAYTWDGVILYAQELTADHRIAAERRSRRAGAAYRDWVGKVPIGDFAALVPREATAKGREGVKRRTLTFSHWPELTAQEPDYLESDGWIEAGVIGHHRRARGLSRLGGHRKGFAAGSAGLQERAAVDQGLRCVGRIQGPAASRERRAGLVGRRCALARGLPAYVAIWWLPIRSRFPKRFIHGDRQTLSE